jgi:dihydrofolate reductase
MADGPSDRQAARPAIALIAAVARNGVIGAGNALPWRLPEDLRLFKRLTLGHAIVMGRRTWESIGRPLAQRQNIVVTRRLDYQAAGADVATSFDDALSRVAMPPPVFCIGGSDMFRIALPRATTLYMTEIDRDFDGDAHFPAFERADWHEVARRPGSEQQAVGFPYAFVVYERTSPR